MRPDLAEARLRLQRGDLELVRTRNGLLPQLDIYVTAGKSGYADRILDTADLSGEGYDVQAGLILRYPWQNSTARAANRRAIVSRAQAEESVANLAQLVEVDVRGAWIDLNRLREQAAATAATQLLQEEKLRAETEKFRVGKSTAFLVAQAQRDLLQAENDTVTAFAGCIKASIELYRLEGSLLARRGIQVPGPPRF
jgi:outer membrane protein TolC